MLIARQNKIQFFKSTETCFTQLSLFFSLSLFLKEKFLCYFFFSYILGRGLISHGVSLCKTPTEVKVIQVTTLFAAVHLQ